uniref:Hypothetical conserved protein n=1 Tax=Glossina morsitans morsitans TaxID=37546 RepID=D3TNR3_GLOMM
MKTTSVGRYALRLSFGQTSSAASESLSSSPDRVLTRSATCLALLGIALSSFSLKQMLANSTNKSSSIPMRKLY